MTLFGGLYHPALTVVPDSEERGDPALQRGHRPAVRWWLDGGTRFGQALHHQNGRIYRLRHGAVEIVSVEVARAAQTANLVS